jgi:hypothetical protein
MMGYEMNLVNMMTVDDVSDDATDDEESVHSDSNKTPEVLHTSGNQVRWFLYFTFDD